MLQNGARLRHAARAGHRSSVPGVRGGRMRRVVLLAGFVFGACADPETAHRGPEAGAATPSAIEADPAPRARQDSSGVTVYLLSGQAIRFENDRREGLDHYVRFEYRGYEQPLRSHLLLVHYYEGERYALIHAERGDTLWLPGEPVTSPSGRWLASASIDLVAGYNPNALEIYRVLPTGFSLAQEFTPEGWGPASPVWVSDDTLRITRTVVEFTDSIDQYVGTPAFVVRRDGRWTLAAESGR